MARFCALSVIAWVTAACASHPYGADPYGGGRGYGGGYGGGGCACKGAASTTDRPMPSAAAAVLPQLRRFPPVASPIGYTLADRLTSMFPRVAFEYGQN